MLLAWGSSSGGRCHHLMVTVIAGQNSDVNPADALCRPLLPALRTVASMFLSSALRVVGVNLVSLSARKPFDSRQCRLRPSSESTHRWFCALFLFSFLCVNANTTVNTWFSNVFYFGSSLRRPFVASQRFLPSVQMWTDEKGVELILSFFLGSYVVSFNLFCMFLDVRNVLLRFLKKRKKRNILISFSIFSINGLLAISIMMLVLLFVSKMKTSDLHIISILKMLL